MIKIRHYVEKEESTSEQSICISRISTETYFIQLDFSHEIYTERKIYIDTLVLSIIVYRQTKTNICIRLQIGLFRSSG